MTLDQNNTENLDWAKEAYEKLKKQQQAKKLENEKKVEEKPIEVENKIELIKENINDIKEADVEPQLGDFDEGFAWSANVLASQGKAIDNISIDEINWLTKLKDGLEKTRKGFVTDLLEKFGDDPLTPEILDDLEILLIRADVGVNATDQIINALRRRLNEEVLDSKEGYRFLKEQLCKILDEPIKLSGSDVLKPKPGVLNIWLIVGVNGVGKTTTLGKLANLALRT